MKVQDLLGAQLDFWVAMAENKRDPHISGYSCLVKKYDDCANIDKECVFSPSLSWDCGGPIIEHNRIDVCHSNDGSCYAVIGKNHEILQDGQSPLIAAMRAYISSVYGDEVPDINGKL